MTPIQLKILLAVLTIGVAFFASAWVQAVSRLSAGRAYRLSEKHEKTGQILVQIAENPRPYLASALLLMLTLRVTATVLIASVLLDSGMAFAEIGAIVVTVLVLFQVAEVAPRSWVLERPDHVLVLSARPVYWLGKVIGPVASFLIQTSRLFMLILPGRGLPKGPITSEEEIKSMLEVAEEEEVIEAEEAEIIQSVFEFGDTVVREILVPRPDMVCVDADAPLDKVLSVAMKNGFSRLPVISENIDNVVGICHIRDVMKKLQNGSKRTRKAKDVMRDSFFVPESKKVIELLREMQREKTHMVIVVDEYGGTAGLVTLEDLLEELVGEISDEYDREVRPVEKVDDTTLRVNARVPIDELNELLTTELPSEEWDSVGGLVGGTLGRVAEEGDLVSVNGIRFEVEKTKGRRIERVLVHLPRPTS